MGFLRERTRFLKNRVRSLKNPGGAPSNIVKIGPPDRNNKNRKYIYTINLPEPLIWKVNNFKEVFNSLSPDHFKRCNRSYVINIAFIRDIIESNTGKYILLSNDEKIRIDPKYDNWTALFTQNSNKGLS